VVAELPGAGRSVVVDNTNPTPEDRARIPLVGLYGTAGRFVPPAGTEGLDRVDVVRTC
jgi:hypothetical protein